MKDEFSTIFLKTLTLIAKLEDEFLELASLLRQVKQTSHDDFKKLYLTPQLGRRKAYYLVSIDKSFGYIVTNNDVVRNAKSVVVTMMDGKTLDAEVVGSDARTDIALLKVRQPGDYPFVSLSKQTPARKRTSAERGCGSSGYSERKPVRATMMGSCRLDGMASA
jgi:hypothetical protein